MRNAKGRRQRKQPKKKKKNKLLRSELSCLKTMQKSVERAKKKKKAYKNRMEIPHKFMK